MKPVWMPLYIADYLKDTSHLRAIESGAYLHLIMAYWVSGKLPTEDRQLATIAKTSDREWRSMKETLAQFFGPNWSSHKRIDKELARAAEVSAKRKQAAELKWSKQNAIADAEADTVHKSQSTKKESKKTIRAVANATSPGIRWFEGFWRVYPKRKGANPRLPAEKIFLRLFSQGEDVELIIAAAAACHGMDPDKVGTEFIPRATTWLNERRWEGFNAAGEQPSEDRIVWMAARGYAWLDNRWQKQGSYHFDCT